MLSVANLLVFDDFTPRVQQTRRGGWAHQTWYVHVGSNESELEWFANMGKSWNLKMELHQENFPTFLLRKVFRFF